MANENNGDTTPEVKLEEEMTAEELKALHDDEDYITNFKDEDLSDPDKVTELAEKLKSAKTTVHQKKHFREKLEEEKKKPKAAGAAEPAAPANEPKKEKQDDAGDENEIKESNAAINFRLDHPELSKEQTKEVLDHARAYKITPEDALKKPIIQKFIATSMAAEDAEEASVKPGNRSTAAIADKDWTNASKEEMEKARNKMLYRS